MNTRNILAIVGIALLAVLSSWRLRVYDAGADAREKERAFQAYMAAGYFHPYVQKDLTATISETEVLEKLKKYKPTLMSSFEYATYSEPYMYGFEELGGKYLLKQNRFYVRPLPFKKGVPGYLQPDDLGILEALLQCHLAECIVKDNSLFARVDAGNNNSPVRAIYGLKPESSVVMPLDAWFVCTSDAAIVEQLKTFGANPFGGGWWSKQLSLQMTELVYRISNYKEIKGSQPTIEVGEVYQVIMSLDTAAH